MTDQILTPAARTEPLVFQEAAPGHHSAGEMFDTWSYESDRPMDLIRLHEMAQRKLPGAVYRCKGILHTVDNPGKRFILQIVGRRTEISELDDWGERTPHTKIVAIGSANEIDADSLTALFESCTSEPEEAR